MKNRYLLMILVSIFLVSCEQNTRLTTTIQGVEQTQLSTDSVFVQPTGTSSPDTVMTETVEQSAPELTKSPSASTPVSTQIPCSGDLTSPNQEGPFYSIGSPERESLIDDGLAGTPILLVGRVFNQECNPIPGVKLDFWLADVNGEYDNIGYTLRGHQFTDETGFYSIESIEPTPYTGRPSHIHVKLFAPDGRELLTTQMYFPGSESSADVQNSPDLLAMYLEPDQDGRQQVLFNFVVQN